MRKPPQGISSRLFYTIVGLDFLSIITDIVSELLWIPVGVRIVTDYLYYIFTVIIPGLYILYLYANIGIWYRLKSSWKTKLAICFPAIVEIFILVVNIFTGWAFGMDDIGRYERRPMQIALIYCDLAYLLVGIILIIKYLKLITFNRLVPLVSLIPLVLIGLYYQQLHRGFETTLFGLTIGILFVSFTVQRNDETSDPVTGLKNLECFKTDISKIYSSRQPVNLLFIKILNQETYRRTRKTSLYLTFIESLTTALKHCCQESRIDYEIYSIRDSVYAIKLETENLTAAVNLAEAIEHKLTTGIVVLNVNTTVEPKICVVRIPDEFSDKEFLWNFGTDFENTINSEESVIVLADIFADDEELRKFKIRTEIGKIVDRALKNHLFEMYYQPIYSVKEKKFVSAEALIRLNDPEYGFVSPELFIPASELNGSIHRIGEFVTEDVCRFISGIDFKELGLKYIEMNLSAAQCLELDLADKISNICKNYKVSPEQLNLEITESSTDFNPVITLKNITELKEKGFSFALDDFGVGYTNMDRVVGLPVDLIKMDKQFVRGLENPKNLCAIENLVKLFNDPVMKVKIVVEGIEDKTSLKVFEDLGCDYIQGYVFSKPLKKNDFIAFLKEKNNA